MFYHISKKVNNKYIPNVILLLLVLSGIYYSHNKLIKRYAINNPLKEYYSLDKTLDSIGISKNEKVISISDNTYCGSLYLMNRLGWTNLNVNPKNKSRSYIIDPKKLTLNTTEYIESEILNRIRKGAKYIITKTNDEFIQFIPAHFVEKKIFANEEITIYKL